MKETAFLRRANRSLIPVVLRSEFWLLEVAPSHPCLSNKLGLATSKGLQAQFHLVSMPSDHVQSPFYRSKALRLPALGLRLSLAVCGRAERRQHREQSGWEGQGATGRSQLRQKDHKASQCDYLKNTRKKKTKQKTDFGPRQGTRRLQEWGTPLIPNSGG